MKNIFNSRYRLEINEIIIDFVDEAISALIIRSLLATFSLSDYIFVNFFI